MVRAVKQASLLQELTVLSGKSIACQEGNTSIQSSPRTGWAAPFVSCSSPVFAVAGFYFKLHLGSRLKALRSFPCSQPQPALSLTVSDAMAQQQSQPGRSRVLHSTEEILASASAHVPLSLCDQTMDSVPPPTASTVMMQAEGCCPLRS